MRVKRSRLCSRCMYSLARGGRQRTGVPRGDRLSRGENGVRARCAMQSGGELAPFVTGARRRVFQQGGVRNEPPRSEGTSRFGFKNQCRGASGSPHEQGGGEIFWNTETG